MVSFTCYHCVMSSYILQIETLLLKTEKNGIVVPFISIVCVSLGYLYLVKEILSFEIFDSHTIALMSFGSINC